MLRFLLSTFRVITVAAIDGLPADRHGLAWCEFDLSWIQIKIFMFFRIAKSVRLAKINTALVEREAA
jgi:hypothetical protein